MLKKDSSAFHRENTWAALGLGGLSLAVALGPLQGLPSAAAVAVGALGLLAVLGLLLRVGAWPALERPAFVHAYGMLCFAVLALTAVFTQHLGRLDGVWYAWLEDDAMVSMQYARHLAAGEGLVWTVGERVQGFSNPLWTLLMAPCVKLLPRALAALPMLLLNVGLGLACVEGVRRLARGLGADPLAAAWAAVGLGFSYELVWAAASGMESVAVASGAAWGFAGLAQARREGREPGWAPFVLAGLVGGLRVDGVLPAFLILALGWRALPWRRRWVALALALGPWLAWMLFAAAYYGACLPNTVLLKQGTWPFKHWMSIRYVGRLPWQAPLTAAFALTALFTSRLRAWLAVLLVLLAYGLLTGGDFYPGTRYIAAAWPLYWALAAAALSANLRPAPAAWLIALAAVLSYHALWVFPGLMQGGWTAAMDRIRLARALDARLRPGESLAAAWAGSFYYFSSARGVDLLGKCDPVVARTQADPQIPWSAHNKMNLEHSLGVRRPDWVAALPPGLPDPAPWLHTAYDRKLWEHPLFQKHCRQCEAGLAGPWLLCRCRWD
jgi:hypothetical protein